MTNIATVTKVDRRAQLQKERQESYTLLAVNVVKEPDNSDDECVDKLQDGRELSPAAASAALKWNLKENTINKSNDCHHLNLNKYCIGNERLEPRTYSGFNTSTVSNLTDSCISSLGDSLSGFGLDSISEMGWDSISDGLGSILKRNDENAIVSPVKSDAIQHRKASNSAPASSTMKSSRLSATPAQIAAAVNLIREQDERRFGRVSIISSRNLNMSLNDIESYAKRNSLATVTNGKGSGQHSNKTFEELCELMGDDAFILDASDCEEDDKDCVWSGLKIDSNSRILNVDG